MPVVDASLVVDLIAPDVPTDSPARRLFATWAAEGAELLAPALMWLETKNALLTGIRRGRWTGAAADAAAARLDRIPVRPADENLDQIRAYELARRYGDWPMYDMLYVALAERLGTGLFTADQRLRTQLDHLGWIHGSQASR